jgi:hypothetical protein
LTLKESAVDFFGAIISGLLTTVAYVVIVFGVYKLFQIANDVREIKELAMSSLRAPSLAVSKTSPAISRDLVAEDSAAAYAEHLLRAVKPE